MDDIFWMTRALLIARKASFLNEIPVGAVLVVNDFEIGISINSCYTSTFYHSEINLINKISCYISKYCLNRGIVYVTLEPCLVCKTVLSFYSISSIVFGVYVNGLLYYDFIKNFRVKGGILFKDSSFLINTFFFSKR
jgi:tRNA(adenine34) deaminase